MTTPPLVTLDEAREHLEVIGTDQDAKIERYVLAASAAVLNYLGATADSWLDTSGWVDPTPDSSGQSAVPAAVRQATLLLLAAFFGHRGEDGGQGAQFAQGYLPAAVTALLYPLRDPSIA